MASFIDTNPAEIQWVKPNTAHRTPLVLIHDGGGTIVSYYFLEDLDRPVWGIGNPRFDSGEIWEGGIPEMASHYIKYIRDAIPAGTSFLLGGWSLGGMLSLEIARQLAGDKDLRIKGIVMIDSIYPHNVQVGHTAPNGKFVLHFKMEFSDVTKESTKVAVTKSFENSTRMLQRWTLPTWDPENGLTPPPTILLRCVDSVPLSEDAPPQAASRVDIWREKEMLGWEDNYPYPFIDKVTPIIGHHFNIFKTRENIDYLSDRLRESCDLLDRGEVKKVGLNMPKKSTTPTEQDGAVEPIVLS